VTFINNVTTGTTTPNPNLPLPGPSSVPSISVTQGTGAGAQATVTNSTLPGNLTIRQNDVAGNAFGDIATVTNDTMGFVQFFNGLPFNGFFGNITVSQGNAAKDVATVTNSTAVGNISITQGNGNTDTATIRGGGPDGVNLTGQSAPGMTYGGNLTITQGSGTNDQATITGSAATPLVTVGNVTITQNDVANATAPNPGDRATVSFVNAGITVNASPFVFDFNGVITITQGNAYNDEAIVLGNGNTANNVVITQGDNVINPNCTPGLSDIAQITGYNITSDISISQGDGNAVGGYVAAIAFDYLGLITNGVTASASVTAGGDTAITQNGSGNSVWLGDPGAGLYGPNAASFRTLYLDVYTGLGSAFVQAANTTVLFGSLFGLYTIDGASITGRNTFLDLGGNSGITINPVTYNYT
jgi:hypothetical protein